MCGIAGFVLNKNKSDKNVVVTLEKMMHSLHHRGPDDWGMSFYGNAINIPPSPKIFTEYSQEYVLGLGHKRLSIIDLSEQGRQPMRDHSGNYEITFNGEIYNYVELREKLKPYYNFRSESDTEVLLAAYSKYGKDMLNMLDGMYGFAIFDKQKKELFCARDHVSIKPFYYSITSDGFFFASEPRAIAEALTHQKNASSTNIANFILTGICDHNSTTFYQDVKQLEGGHYLVYDLNEHSVKSFRKYWNPDRATKNIAGRKDTFIATLTDSIHKQLRSDVVLGSSLSGGIDSGSIVTLAGQLLGDRAKEYKAITFSHPGFKNDESQRAQLIASNAGMQWTPVSPSTDDVEKDIEKMMVNMGEPFSTLSMYAQFKVMEAAHQAGIKVMLDGQGGDEVFLGYPRMAQFVVKHYLSHGNITAAIQELTGLKKNASLSPLSVIAGNILYNSPSLYINRSINKYSDYVNKELLMDYDKTFVSDYYAPKSVYEKQFDELTKYCLPRLLKYADRNSMFSAIESRVPLLGKQIVEFGLTLPLKDRVHNGWTKYIIRTSMEGQIPSEILWDNVKRGFDIPQQYWVGKLNKKLTSWIEEAETGDLFNKQGILKDLNNPKLSGDPGLWRIISIICWMNLLNVKH